MTNRPINSFRPQVLVIFLVAFGLLFAGVRVPDISRPHRPKPTHRVVLESHQKNFSNHIKPCADTVAVLPKLLLVSDRLLHQLVSQVVPPPYAALLWFSNSGRSPPPAALS